MYKLLATDMDGTLLNKARLVSRENAAALRRASRLGVQIAVCSGRSYPTVMLHMRLAGVRPWVLAANGAIAYDPEGRVQFTAPIKDSLARTVIGVLRQFQIPFQMYTTAGVVGEAMPPTSFGTKVTWSKYPNPRDYILMKLNRYYNQPRLVPDVTVLLNGNGACLKFFCPEGKAGSNAECLAELRRQGLPLAYSATGEENFELNAEGTNKGAGLEWLAGKLGIDRSEVIALGDHMNDLEMLRWAGAGVAVANAVPAAKEAASHLTVSHEESAMAAVVREFLLREG